MPAGVTKIEPEGAERPEWDVDARLRETNHRVANHLQILASLIGLEARVQDEPVRERLLDVRRRILAVARVHNQLQDADIEQRVDLPRYVSRLGEDLKLTFGGGPLLHMHADPGDVSGDTAVTLGLIINELVTNAMKHAAMPVGGVVDVRLVKAPEGAWRLTVADEGPGLPAGAMDSPDQHGLALVQLLAARLRGRLTVDPAPTGTSISVTFF